MAKPRVHEVAKELGLSSKEVLAHLEEIGHAVKSHSSTIDEELAARVKSELSDGAAAAEAPSAVATAAPPEPVEEPAADEPAAAAEPEPVEEAPEAEPAREEIRVHRGITVKDFAERVGVAPQEVVKILLGLGEMVTVTQSMSDEAVLLVAEDVGVPVRVVAPGEDEEEEDAGDEVELDGEGAEIITRPPVVTVMGHVDHGKTSILDALRKTSVVEGEAGGITQHIGAYQISVDGRLITFIDTPGHEAFTAMRARGAQVTDIAVLVVAADDGVKPQTVEALDHAKAAGVPIVVAVNKIDRPEADTQRVRQQLSEYELLPEEWGGDTIFVDVSAKEGTNLDSLLEMILLSAEVNLDLKTNAGAMARGVVIEAHLDKGRGPVATVLVKRGTLYAGDAILAGKAWGRVRAMLDDAGEAVDEATPGQPVQILGWQSLPDAGDDFRALEDEREARDIAQEREHHRREAELVAQRAVSLQSLLTAAREGETPELNLLVKADAQGSIEALIGQLDKIEQELVKVNVIRKGVGAVTENDITLAQASGAIVVGFNVVPTTGARTLAEEEGVDVRTYRVIYKAVEEIEAAARGILGPEEREVTLGQAEVRATFRVPRMGTVAGCYVTDGVIRRNARVRLVRDGAIIYESGIASLKRFKDDVREVAQGYECGIGIQGFQDVKEGDIIQAFEVQEVAR
ncbi:MAG TPA: translation initiation factor IF-2 [Actinomycetota bacterium]|jgi:translation initiation factor IF-2|nr:translation initiation factor IF-2 [Actinomycetota bacterium]